MSAAVSLRRFVLAMLPLLTACGSTPSVRHFVLAPVIESPAHAATVPVVVVRDVRLPAYLDRAPLVSRDGAHRVVVSDQDRWAGDLRQDLMRVLAENLGHRLASTAVVAAPHRLTTPPDFHVDVDVARFERDSDARVVLEARWSLGRGGDTAPIARARLERTVPTAGTTAEAQVAAMSQACGELARQIADAIDRATRPR